MLEKIRFIYGAFLVVSILCLPGLSAAATDTDTEQLLRTKSGVQGKSAYTSYPELGLAFRSPEAVQWLDSDEGVPNPEQYSLSVVVQPLSSLQTGADVIPQDSREEALKEQAALEQGRPGETTDQFVEGTVAVQALPGGPSAKTFTVLSRFEVCDVTFERIAIFYWKDCRVTLRLFGPKAAIMRENPDLFIQDKDNCGDEPLWNYHTKYAESFTDALRAGTAGKHAARWNELFDQILQGIQFGVQTSAVSDPAVCQKAAARLEQRSSGVRPLVEKSLAVTIPNFGDACLLVAEVVREKGEMLYLIPKQGDFLENLPLAPNCRSFVSGLKAADLNRDGFPDFLVHAECGTAAGAKPANRVFWSSSNVLGVEWQGDAEMNAAVKNAQTPDAMAALLRGLLADLNKDAGKTLRLKGRFVREEQQLQFQADGQAPDVVYEVVSVPESFAVQCRGQYDRSGEIDATIRRVERMHGISRIQLELRNCL